MNFEESKADSDDESVVDTLQMLLQMEAMDEELLFASHGYMKESTLCKTMHGEVYKARKVNDKHDHDKSTHTTASYVAIKRASRYLTNQGISIQSGFQFVVSEDLQNEASVLKTLTVSPPTNRNHNRYIDSFGAEYIVNYIDSFESAEDYYLVMEYVESEMNLRQFVSKCHASINNKQMSFTHYVKMIKFLLWQLCSTVHWMHTSKQTCHLNLHMDNIMVENAHFSADESGQISIDRNISIKLCEFGVATQFNNADTFQCDKSGLNIDNEAYLAPEVFAGDIYDARDADNWSLGIILFECLTGRPLYSPLDVAEMNNAYLALHRGELKAYLQSSHLCQYFGSKSSLLLSQLLLVDAAHRVSGIAILQHAWFQKYYKEYGNRIRTL